MKIENNKVVTLIYDLRVDGENEEIIEQVTKEEPLEFIYGVGSMLQKFEENLKELNKGDTFKFKIECADAYGEAIEDAIVDIPKETFIVDGELDNEMLFEGNIIPMKDEEGNMFDGIVVEVSKDMVTMDFNHPFSGDDLYFSGEIIDIREATEDELKTGFQEQE